MNWFYRHYGAAKIIIHIWNLNVVSTVPADAPTYIRIWHQQTHYQLKRWSCLFRDSLAINASWYVGDQTLTTAYCQIISPHFVAFLDSDEAVPFTDATYTYCSMWYTTYISQMRGLLIQLKWQPYIMHLSLSPKLMSLSVGKHMMM